MVLLQRQYTRRVNEWMKECLTFKCCSDSHRKSDTETQKLVNDLEKYGVIALSFPST